MLRLTQEMKLAQKLDVRMIQSLKLLPLTTMQLEQRIHEELETNPMLQIDETAERVEETTRHTAAEDGQVNTNSMDSHEDGDFTEAEWSKYFEDNMDYSYNSHEEYDPNYEEKEPTQTYIRTLSEHLSEQLGLMVKTEEERELGEIMIGYLNDDGLFELSEEEISKDLGVPVENIKNMIELIQQMDPPGVGARSIRECLLLQLKDNYMEGTLPYEIVEKHFGDLSQHKFKEIIKALSISEDDFKEAVKEITTLSLSPGSIFKDTSNNSVIPDITIEKVDDDYVVFLNDQNIPRLTMNSSYQMLIEKKAKSSAETRKYLIDKLNSAKWFINSIEQRRSTILKVTNAIVEKQRDFLEHGLSHLRPMTLQDIAEQIGVAVSTVQRVTTGKYAQTPKGVFELKYFFTQRISSTDGQEDFSSKTVKEKLKETVEKENPKKPLSDQKITEILNKQGIDISRRAIAKYREELRIPPARLRKQL